jgi:fatty acid synthase
MGVVCAGQANYGYANSAVDAMCQARKNAGLPAISIQWGPIADVGFVAEKMKVLTLQCNPRMTVRT